jgi:hypothetical protein
VLLVLVLLGAECGTQTAARSLLRVACTAHRSTAKQIKVGTTLVIVTIIIIITIITIITITTTTIITTTSKQAPHRLGFGARLPKRHSATRLEHALQHRVELRQNGTFLSVSLCLSRACLGKMLIFIYKWLKKCRFLTCIAEHTATHNQTHNTGKRHSTTIDRQSTI